MAEELVEDTVGDNPLRSRAHGEAFQIDSSRLQCQQGVKTRQSWKVSSHSRRLASA